MDLKKLVFFQLFAFSLNLDYFILGILFIFLNHLITLCFNLIFSSVKQVIYGIFYLFTGIFMFTFLKLPIVNQYILCNFGLIMKVLYLLKLILINNF